MAQKVLALFNTTRDRKCHLAFVGNECVDGPRIGGGVETVFGDLEPLKASNGGLECVGHFGEVRDDRALVRWVDRVLRIASGLVQDVMPLIK